MQSDIHIHKINGMHISSHASSVERPRFIFFVCVSVLPDQVVIVQKTLLDEDISVSQQV